MTTYGIVAEGNYDEAALIELIKKCLSENIEVIPRRCGGKDRLMNKFPAYLESFRYANQGQNVDKALVIRDADAKDPNELLERMKNKIAGRNYPFEVKFIPIVQELETWLLADENAISKVTGTRSGRTVSRINKNIESILDPKGRLQNILSAAGVPYTPVVAQEITRELNISTVEYRCPGFKEFRQAVIDC
ncbi:MAG: DUF4276 family protein [Nitrospirota bacterium]